MAVYFSELVVDCTDVSRESQFWCAVLGMSVLEEEDGVVEISALSREEWAALAPERRPPTIVFVPVPEGKAVKDRIHIDVSPVRSTRDAEVERILALGARHADVGQSDDVSWVVLASPDGHEFCVLGGSA